MQANAFSLTRSTRATAIVLLVGVLVVMMLAAPAAFAAEKTKGTAPEAKAEAVAQTGTKAESGAVQQSTAKAEPEAVPQNTVQAEPKVTPQEETKVAAQVEEEAAAQADLQADTKEELKPVPQEGAKDTVQEEGGIAEQAPEKAEAHDDSEIDQQANQETLQLVEADASGALAPKQRGSEAEDQGARSEAGRDFAERTDEQPVRQESAVASMGSGTDHQEDSAVKEAEQTPVNSVKKDDTVKVSESKDIAKGSKSLKESAAEGLAESNSKQGGNSEKFTREPNANKEGTPPQQESTGESTDTEATSASDYNADGLEKKTAIKSSRRLSASSAKPALSTQAWRANVGITASGDGTTTLGDTFTVNWGNVYETEGRFWFQIYIYGPSGNTIHTYTSNTYNSGSSVSGSFKYTSKTTQQAGIWKVKMVLHTTNGTDTLNTDYSWMMKDVAIGQVDTNLSQGHTVTAKNSITYYANPTAGSNVKYEWYWNTTGDILKGTRIAGANSSSYTINNIPYSYNGRYYFCWLKNSSGVQANDYRMVKSSPASKLTVNKKRVAVPTVNKNLVYSGSNRIGVSSGNGYSLSGSYTGKDAGSYSAKATLDDIDNTTWSDGSINPKSYTWTIARKSLTPPTVNKGLTYSGKVQTGISGGSGCVTKGTWTATNAGTYTATASLPDSKNYSWSDGTTTDKKYTWSIAFGSVDIPTVTNRFTYNGSERTALVYGPGYSRSGVYSATNAGSYTAYASLNDSLNYRWAGGLDAGTKTFNWSIMRKSITAPSIESKLVYNGKNQTGVSGGSGYTKTGSFTAKNAGQYTAIAKLPDDKNYQWADGTTGIKNYTWNISKKNVALPKASTGIVYDEKYHQGVSSGKEYTRYCANGTKSDGQDCCNAGSYVTILKLNDSTNYQWSDGTSTDKRLAWKIEPRPILDLFDIDNVVYTGKAIEPCIDAYAITAEGKYIFAAEPDDLKTIFSNNVNAGTATVKVTGTGNFAGTITRTFKIAPRSIAKAGVSGIVDKAYTGKAQTQKPTVKLTGCKPTYKVTYSKNVNAGTATVKVTGTGNFAGTITRTFKITPLSIAKAAVSGIAARTYTGKAQMQKPAVKLAGYKPTYKVAYSKNVNAGTATVKVTGTGNFTGAITRTFKIIPRSIAKASVSGIAATTYTGKAQTQKVSLNLPGYKPTYKVTYKNNVNAGTATATIAGTGNFAGTITRTFKIAPRSIAKAGVSGIVDKAYTGKAQMQKPAVKLAGYKPTYKVAYSKNVNAGTATVKITGTGNFGGTVTKTFKINPAALAAKNVAISNANYVYNGKTQKPGVTVKIGSKTLKAGTDYTITYDKDTKNVGAHTVKVTGKGNYKGAFSKSYTIAPQASEITKTRVFDAIKGGGIEVAWRKVYSQINGYEICLSTSRSFSSGLRQQRFDTSSAIGKKCIVKGQSLNKGTTYYIKLRTYKMVGNKAYYSAWSGVKSAKTLA